MWLALFSLIYWFAPAGLAPDIAAIFSEEAPMIVNVANMTAYSLAVLFIEPFYVAAGFAMYLNRRAELEAWDIEQEFRHAFARLRPRRAGGVVVLATVDGGAGGGAPGDVGAGRDHRR